MGIETTVDGRVTQLQSPSSHLINGGVYWVQPSFLQKLTFSTDMPLSLENEILPKSQFSGLGLFGIEFASPFIDIGVPKDYRRAAENLPILINRNPEERTLNGILKIEAI
jgi:D-glycero-alpha-D-manno-heptose 1-phosphate guanylyltransferase